MYVRPISSPSRPGGMAGAPRLVLNDEPSSFTSKSSTQFRNCWNFAVLTNCVDIRSKIKYNTFGKTCLWYRMGCHQSEDMGLYPFVDLDHVLELSGVNS